VKIVFIVIDVVVIVVAKIIYNINLCCSCYHKRDCSQ